MRIIMSSVEIEPPPRWLNLNAYRVGEEMEKTVAEQRKDDAPLVQDDLSKLAKIAYQKSGQRAAGIRQVGGGGGGEDGKEMGEFGLQTGGAKRKRRPLSKRKSSRKVGSKKRRRSSNVRKTRKRVIRKKKLTNKRRVKKRVLKRKAVAKRGGRKKKTVSFMRNTVC